LTFPQDIAKHPSVKTIAAVVLLAVLSPLGLQAGTVSLDQGGIQFETPPSYQTLTEQQHQQLMPFLKGFDVKICRDLGSPLFVAGCITRFSASNAAIEKGRLSMNANTLLKLTGVEIRLIHNDYTLINGTQWLYTDIITKGTRTLMLQTSYRGRVAMVMEVLPAMEFAKYRDTITSVAMSLKVDLAKSADQLPYTLFDPAQDWHGPLK
jgi:hypothetical protein